MNNYTGTIFLLNGKQIRRHIQAENQTIAMKKFKSVINSMATMGRIRKNEIDFLSVSAMMR